MVATQNIKRPTAVSSSLNPAQNAKKCENVFFVANYAMRNHISNVENLKKEMVVIERIVCFDLKNEPFQFHFYFFNVLQQSRASKIKTIHLDSSVSFKVPVI